MKALHALLILLLAYLYNAAETCSITGTEPKKASDCKDRTIPTGYAKCCFTNVKYYVKGEMTEGKTCVPREQKYYDNFVPIFKSAKKSIEAQGGSIDVYEVDCSTNYLYISLLSLIICLL